MAATAQNRCVLASGSVPWAQIVEGAPALRAAFAPLAEPASKVVVEALGKPALRLDGVLALTLAALVAAASSDAGKADARCGRSPRSGLRGFAAHAAAVGSRRVPSGAERRVARRR